MATIRLGLNNSRELLVGVIHHRNWCSQGGLRSICFAISLLTALTITLAEMSVSFGQVSGRSSTTQDPIAEGLLHSYISSLPEGMFFGTWQMKHGDRSNIENQSILSVRSPQASGEWKIAFGKFEWFRAEVSPETFSCFLIDRDQYWALESSRDSQGLVSKIGTIGAREIGWEPFSFHEYRGWWPLLLINVSQETDDWILKRVEVRGERTFIHFNFTSSKSGFFELDLRDGFQVVRVFEESTEPSVHDFSHDWTFENQSVIVDGKKYWFPKSFQFFFHLRTAGQNKKKELIADFSAVGYSSIAVKPHLDFPDGTRVNDYIEGKNYRVGGSKVSAEKLEEFQRVIARKDAETAPDLRGVARSSSFGEIAWWVTAAALLLCGCAFGIYRFRRKQK